MWVDSTSPSPPLREKGNKRHIRSKGNHRCILNIYLPSVSNFPVTTASNIKIQKKSFINV